MLIQHVVRIIDSLKDIYATGIDEVSVVVEDIELKRKDFSLFGQNNDTISKKISFILENITKLEYNVNILLFMDNLLIGIGEILDD